MAVVELGSPSLRIAVVALLVAGCPKGVPPRAALPPCPFKVQRGHHLLEPARTTLRACLEVSQLGDLVEIAVSSNGPCEATLSRVAVGESTTTVEDEPRIARVPRVLFQQGHVGAEVEDACGHVVRIDE